MSAALRIGQTVRVRTLTLELGSGFTFVARQKRLQISTDSSFPHVLGGNPVRAVRAASAIGLLRSEFDAGPAKSMRE
jgi:hypothetical protein